MLGWKDTYTKAVQNFIERGSDALPVGEARLESVEKILSLWD